MKHYTSNFSCAKDLKDLHAIYLSIRNEMLRSIIALEYGITKITDNLKACRVRKKINRIKAQLKILNTEYYDYKGLGSFAS